MAVTSIDVDLTDEMFMTVAKEAAELGETLEARLRGIVLTQVFKMQLQERDDTIAKLNLRIKALLKECDEMETIITNEVGKNFEFEYNHFFERTEDLEELINNILGLNEVGAFERLNAAYEEYKEKHFIGRKITTP